MYDEAYGKLLERFQESAFILEECAHDLRDFSENVFFDEQRQIEIEEADRTDWRLKKEIWKHGRGSSCVL